MLVTEAPDIFLGVPTYVYGIQLLEDQPELLHSIWALYQQEIGEDANIDNFVSLVESLVGECQVCYICDLPAWDDDCSKDVDGEHVCEACRDDHCRSCDRCEEFSNSDEFLTYVVGGCSYCDDCLSARASWCEFCDEYWEDNSGHDFDHEDENDEDNADPNCDCSPQRLNFEIPANSHGTLKQDERLLVELPAGNIDQRTISDVIHMIWSGQTNADGRHLGETVDYHSLTETIEELEPVWSTTKGSFTKRLSKALYQRHGIKLVGELMSTIGTVVRERSGTTSSWYVEFTRDLNQPDHHFGNSGSCWWRSESQSLCALKSWGGLGLRSYEFDGQARWDPSGRAWIQPLDTALQPTNDVLGAHAYVVYNCYGNLSGYTSARVMAYLASRSYRKVSLAIGYQYVNSDMGYLIADQATCESITHISIENLTDHEVVAA